MFEDVSVKLEDFPVKLEEQCESYDSSISHPQPNYLNNSTQHSADEYLTAATTSSTNLVKAVHQGIELELTWKMRDEIISTISQHTKLLSGLIIKSNVREKMRKTNGDLVAKLMNLPRKGDAPKANARLNSYGSYRRQDDGTNDVILELNQETRARIINTLLSNHEITLESESVPSECKSQQIDQNNELASELLKLRSRALQIGQTNQSNGVNTSSQQQYSQQQPISSQQQPISSQQQQMPQQAWSQPQSMMSRQYSQSMMSRQQMPQQYSMPPQQQMLSQRQQMWSQQQMQPQPDLSWKNPNQMFPEYPMHQNRPSMQPSPPKMANLNTQSNFAPNNGQQSSLAATSITNLNQSASSNGLPLKRPTVKPWTQIAKVCQILGLAYDSASNEMRLPASSQLDSASNRSLYSSVEAIPITDLNSLASWQQQISLELRSHVLHKMLAALHSPSTDDQNTVKAEPMSDVLKSLIEKVQKVESQAYKIARSKEEYYQATAKWIYGIRMKLSVKREMKKNEYHWQPESNQMDQQQALAQGIQPNRQGKMLQRKNCGRS